MKRTNKLLILLAVLLVLVLAYAVMIKTLPHEDEDGEKTVTYEATDITRENITEIAFDRGDGELAFEANGDTWVYADAPSLPIDGAKISNMADTMAELAGSYRITDISDEAFKEYGLAEPSLTVKITENGMEKAYRFGIFNSSVESYYFCSENLQKLVFLVSKDAFDAFDYSMEDIIVKEDSPKIEADDVTSISLTDSEGNAVELALVKTLVKEGDEENEPEYDVTATRTEGTKVSDYLCADFYELADQISNIKFDTLAGFKEEDGAKLGFDKASVLTVKYTERKKVEADGAKGGYIENEKTLTLYIGKDGENTYCKTSHDSLLIYKLSDINLDF